MRVGPRAAMTAASACFGGGLIIGGIGIDMHSLPLMYAGYGLLGGTGVGLAYTPPVQALISWFPDKKGLASGLTIAGFGSGALVFTPLINNLMAKFAKVCSTDMIK
jgi:MFS family permease